MDSAKKNIPLSIFRDSTHARTLKLQANWQEGQTYKLLFLPMSLTDIYGLKNDTIAMNVFIQNKQEFGDIVLNIQNLDSTKNYISQIITPTGEIETAFYIQKKSYFETRIQTVQPDQYTLKIIEDANENKRWDTGDYDTKQQPERIFLKKLEALRPNWELEANFDFKDIKN